MPRRTCRKSLHINHFRYTTNDIAGRNTRLARSGQISTGIILQLLDKFVNGHHFLLFHHYTILYRQVKYHHTDSFTKNTWYCIFFNLKVLPYLRKLSAELYCQFRGRFYGFPAPGPTLARRYSLYCVTNIAYVPDLSRL